ncbi:MAG: DUF2163 domain-containing protein [Hyphomicrobium sp.]
MKDLTPGLRAHLDSGTTTLCWCWRLTRNDGTVQGFTDHDRALSFDSTTFEASSGFTASEITDALGLSVDNLEVTGALSSASLSEDDLAAGRYDDARVEIFRVNWKNPDERVVMRTGSLGEVRRAGNSFTAEVRGLAHYLQQPKGRLFQYTCDADLGDARCGVDLDTPTFKATGTISAVLSARKFHLTGLDGYESGFFARGLARFAGGASDGLAIEIKSHVKSAGIVSLELWSEASGPPSVGDTIIVKAGCDKRIETCAVRFANAVNFRGFPDMPGNDFFTRIASRRAAS